LAPLFRRLCAESPSGCEAGPPARIRFLGEFAGRAVRARFLAPLWHWIEAAQEEIDGRLMIIFLFYYQLDIDL